MISTYQKQSWKCIYFQSNINVYQKRRRCVCLLIMNVFLLLHVGLFQGITVIISEHKHYNTEVKQAITSVLTAMWCHITS